MAAADKIPATMKAWVVTSTGEPKTALTLKTDWPVPNHDHRPKGTDLLIKVVCASLNPVDTHLTSAIPSWLPFRRNPVPGLDFCGTVVAAGPGAAPPEVAAVGTMVCGAMNVAAITVGKGSLAEYVCVPASLVAAMPAGLDPARAAGLLGVAGQTAELLMREAKIVGGERVLVNGASGGVGSILVQIAKARGAVVTGVCSEANVALVKSLGADDVIDYTLSCHEPLHAWMAGTYEKEPFDIIFDTVGNQALFSHSPPYLKPKGQFLSIAGGRSQGVVPFVRNKMIPSILGGTPRTFKILGLNPSGEFAREVAKWAEKGDIKQVLIDSEYSMEDAIKGFERVMTKRSKGKVIIKIAE